jgi:sialate O-acetylesterase
MYQKYNFKNFRQWLFLLAILIFFPGSRAISDVSLPVVLSDHMVLQRNMDIKIWGWADKGEIVIIQFNNQVQETVTGQDGNWYLILDAMPAGGPFDMTVKGKNTIKLKDILIGDVWICSGQSNMEWPVERSNNPEKEIAAANFPEIRLFDVKRRMSEVPLDDYTDEKWQVCSPMTIAEFSAVGYFFGRELHKDLNVPVGLISTNWGGTVAETWTSFETIAGFSEFDDKMNKLKSLKIAELSAKKEQLQKQWDAKIDGSDTGLKENWHQSQEIDTTWKKMKLPQKWERAGLKGFDGIVWFMYQIELTQEESKEDLELHLGPVDDTDYTYVNGVQVGSIKKKWQEPRTYNVSAGILKPGKNIIAVRVIDYRGGGGIYGKPEDMFYVSNKRKVSLAGEWHYKPGTDRIPDDYNIHPNNYPTLLYNGMIHPLIPYAITGAIWYQGESNASRAYQYRKIFKGLILDWREKWDQGDFPFLFVQLANYKKPVKDPGDSDWAELREAQNMALELPNTGVAVIIDIGEADDIHPRNKQDVGYRLSLAAKKIAYGQDIVFSGPMYRSMQVEDNKVRIRFKHTGSGLMIKDAYGYLKGFSIAGEDRQFFWAKAYTEGNDVIVYSDLVAKPVAVRYGWADNPHDLNLYNKEGLPGSPFRTDSWPGITENPDRK